MNLQVNNHIFKAYVYAYKFYLVIFDVKIHVFIAYIWLLHANDMYWKLQGKYIVIFSFYVFHNFQCVLFFFRTRSFEIESNKKMFRKRQKKY